MVVIRFKSLVATKYVISFKINCEESELMLNDNSVYETQQNLDDSGKMRNDIRKSLGKSLYCGMDRF